MNAPVPKIEYANPADAEAILREVTGRLRGGSVIPYL